MLLNNVLVAELTLSVVCAAEDKDAYVITTEPRPKPNPHAQRLPVTRLQAAGRQSRLSICSSHLVYPSGVLYPAGKLVYRDIRHMSSSPRSTGNPQHLPCLQLASCLRRSSEPTDYSDSARNAFNHLPAEPWRRLQSPVKRPFQQAFAWTTPSPTRTVQWQQWVAPSRAKR